LACQKVAHTKNEGCINENNSLDLWLHETW